LHSFHIGFSWFSLSLSHVDSWPTDVFIAFHIFTAIDIAFLRLQLLFITLFHFHYCQATPVFAIFELAASRIYISATYTAFAIIFIQT